MLISVKETELTFGTTDFEFIVKVNKATTHEGKDAEVAASFLQSIRPLSEAGKLKGLLAQFPWGFKNTPENRDYLKGCRERTPDIPYFVEFRHRSWVSEEVGNLLREHQLSFVCVDEPQIGDMMPPMARATTNLGYIRFHGRNAKNWWGKGGDRYDYLYTEDELRTWVGKVEQLLGKVDKIYLFFNNCHAGQAVENARMMKAMPQLKLNL